jgi:hypothetical protein
MAKAGYVIDEWLPEGVEPDWTHPSLPISQLGDLYGRRR